MKDTLKKIKYSSENTLIVFSLLFTLFNACSSGPEKEKEKPIEEKKAMLDTSLHGLAGVIEKNPPLEYGDYVSKYPNGVIKLKGYYVKGKREGQWVGFYENGTVWTEGFYKGGLRDGKATVYHENGKKYYGGFYKDGKQAGKWTFYNLIGDKIKEIDYDK